MSLPSRERGLKCQEPLQYQSWPQVAPFAGAWIEIDIEFADLCFQIVAPFAGAWIEILSLRADR